MKTLLGLTFSIQYRANLVLDGIMSTIEDVEVLDPTPWCTELMRGWLWDFLMEIALDLPMVRHAVPPLLGFTFFFKLYMC